MNKILLAAGLLCMSYLSSAQCTAVWSLEENFNDFEGTAFPQECWLKIAQGPMVYLDDNRGTTDKYVTYYSSTSPSVPGFLITPEIAASTDDYAISFESFKIGSGSVTIQIGTISNPEDQTTFSPVGELINLTAAPSTYAVEIPLRINSRLAFKVVATELHHAASIDDVMLVSLLGTKHYNSNNASLAVYPNPSSDRNVNLAYNLTNTGVENGTVSIYSVTGAKVFETSIAAVNNANTKALNLSDLNAGIYLVKLEAGTYTETTKLVIK
jgi:hypothetical protein